MDLSAQLSTSTHARCERVAGGAANPFLPIRSISGSSANRSCRSLRPSRFRACAARLEGGVQFSTLGNPSLFQLKNEPEGSLRVWLRKAPFLILYRSEEHTSELQSLR